VSTRISDARRVESHYGDLDELHERDGLEGLRALAYSSWDRSASKFKPSLTALDGDLYDSLASYRAAVAALRLMVTVPEIGGLRELLDWYVGGSGSLDRYRRLFVARYQMMVRQALLLPEADAPLPASRRDRSDR
jgi:hypothetical protein